ncbi:MAG: phytanoyl-CoA dioxygenase family protein [Actinobacteria bacterium]|nr:phytanoyl-CoA dioxygenase family protein [Actinomycetota bacterium]
MDHAEPATLEADGHVRIDGALDPAFCEQVVAEACAAAGFDADDRSTWPDRVTHLPVTTSWSFEDVAPAVVPTLERLVGPADGVRYAGIQDNLIANPPAPPDRWWDVTPGTVDRAGWHKDGDWFRHYLDSPEQALLVIVFWRDVEADQGPTWVAVDSIGPVARLLAEHPEGLDPADLAEPCTRIVAASRDLRPLTGRQGDVVLAHPFMLHTATPNRTDRLRLIANSSVMLREPIALDPPTTGVGRATAAALGVDRVAFTATGERRKVESERERRWRDARS